MNPIDAVSKATKVLVDSVKDAIELNLVRASQEGRIDLSEEQLRQCVVLVKATADESYLRGLSTFQKMCSQHVISPKK